MIGNTILLTCQITGALYIYRSLRHVTCDMFAVLTIGVILILLKRNGTVVHVCLALSIMSVTAINWTTMT